MVQSEGAGAHKARGQQTYHVLARKYRPQDFTSLIGQQSMIRTLSNAFASGRIAQAWMLTGVRGVGKTTTARILARALNYKTPAMDRPSVDLLPLGEHCQAIMEGRHIDVVEMDAASHTGIDDIRDLIEQSHYRPVSARYKVYIVDEVHMLSTQAFNGLLKTLEEPPPHVKFIFATTEIRKVPVTVLSRCQRFDLRRVDSDELMAHLMWIAAQEGIEAQEEALAMIARAGEGSVRDALSMLDQAIAHGAGRVEAAQVRSMLGLASRARIIDLFESIMRADVALALQQFKTQYDEGADPRIIITELAEFNHLVTRLRFMPESGGDSVFSEDERVRGTEFAQKLSLRTLSQTWQMLLKGLSEIDQAPHPCQAAEMLLIRLAYAADLPSLDEVIKDFKKKPPEAGLAPPLPAIPLSQESVPSGEAEKKNLLPTVKIEEIKPSHIEKVNAQHCEEPYERQDNIHGGKSSGIKLDSLAAILAHADRIRDLSFKTHLKEYVRPVNIGQGFFEFSPTENAPRSLVGLIGKTLQEWTGERWHVVIKPDKGEMTVNEQIRARRETLMSDAASDGEVSAILAQFPGAQIVDVRLKEDNGEGAFEPELRPDLADESDGSDED